MKRWLVFGNHVLGKSTLPARERELVILRIGWLCRSGYEWGQHVAIGKAAGLSDEEIARIPKGADAAGWSAADRALLRATDELHGDAFISDATWAELARLARHAAADRSRVHGRPVQPGVDGAEQLRRAAGAGSRAAAARVSGRLAGKVAIVVGAGQTPGDTIGNGRATALLFAREGARVRRGRSPARFRRGDGRDDPRRGRRGRGVRAPTRRARPTAPRSSPSCVKRYGRIDVLHNNVGIGGGDAGPDARQRRGLGPHPLREPQERDLPVQARAAGDARAEGRRDHERLVDRRDLRDARGRLQDLEGRHQRLHPDARDRQREVRHPRERDHARAHGDADGDRGALAASSASPRRS